MNAAPTLSPASARRLSGAVRAFALLLIALHLAAPSLPEDLSWGIFPYTYLRRAVQWALGAAGALLCLPAANRVVRRILAWLARHWPAARLRRLWFALFSLAMVIPFWFGRIVHTRWGDAYILVNAISHPDVRLTYTWQAPLDLFLHAKAWAWANSLWGWDAMRTYHVLSSAAGAVFLFLLLCAADDLGRTPVEKALFAGWVATLGLMQFFFGYVENYVFMTIGVLAYLWLGVRAVEGRTSELWPAGILASTHAFHPSTILGLDASFLALWAMRAFSRPRRERLMLTLKLLIPFLLVFAGVVWMMEAGGHGISTLLGSDAPGGGDRSWFVPLSKIDSRWEHYTMFSWGHLVDILNEQVLVAPFGLAMVLLALTTRAGRAALRRPAGQFLAVAALNYLLFTLVWNPDYGGRRDWDLFAPMGIPLTLFAAYLWVDMGRAIEDASQGSEWLGEIALIVAGVSAIFTGAWVYSNTIPWSW